MKKPHLTNMLIIATVLAVILTLVSLFKKEDQIFYNGYEVRVTKGCKEEPSCKIHLTIYEPNNAGYISFCDVTKNPDPNNIRFEIVNTNHLSEGSPIEHLQDSPHDINAYLHWKAETERREKEATKQ